MFRESDYIPPRLHPSYSRKPVPTLQLLQSISPLEVAADAPATNTQSMPQPVPATYDTFYDPNHPDADWSGFVNRKAPQKRHVDGHSSMKCNIKQTEDGFVGDDDRSLFRRLNNENRTPRSEAFISGIDVSDEERYRSNNRRQAEFIPTSTDQMTLMKRTGPRKNIRDPAQATGQYSNPFVDQSNLIQSSRPLDQSSSNFKNPPSINHGRSLIANIGASLVNHVPREPQPTMNSRNALSKDLISQNYKPAPGYTGRRAMS